jgi:hypothetical protein
MLNEKLYTQVAAPVLQRVFLLSLMPHRTALLHSKTWLRILACSMRITQGASGIWMSWASGFVLLLGLVIHNVVGLCIICFSVRFSFGFAAQIPPPSEAVA